MSIVKGAGCLFALVVAPAFALAQAEETPIRVAELLKIHRSGADNFDRQFKGKTITIAGTVSDASFLPEFSGKIWLHVADGNELLLCEYNDGLKGLRINHRVQLQGVCDPHKKFSETVQLRGARVVKVEGARDYPPSKEVVAEIAKLQGNWRVKQMTTRGKKAEGWDKVSFHNHQIHLHDGNQLFMFGLSIEPTRKPAQFDMYGKGTPVPGIYQFDGDELKLCIPENPRMLPPMRPMNFNTTGRLQHLLVLEREKKS